MLEGMSEKNFTLEELAMLFDCWKSLYRDAKDAREVFLDAAQSAVDAGQSINGVARAVGITAGQLDKDLRRRKNKVK